MPIPVGQTEIAERAGVKPDTVKKWRERDPGFPRPRWTVGSGPAWEWGDVLKWLRATNRAPNHIRWRSLRSDGTVILEEALDADDNWEAVAKFVGDDSEGWTAFPCPGLDDCDEPQLVADRHLRQWCEVRQKWARENPDEPMPEYLAGKAGPDTKRRLDELGAR